jgi:hypothetical protein
LHKANVINVTTDTTKQRAPPAKVRLL